MICGLTLHSTREQIYRALLESIAFGNRRIMDNFAEHGLELTEIVACGGIAERSPLLMQLFADTSGLAVQVPASSEVPARGAALFGAVAAGAFDDIGAAVAATRPGDRAHVPPGPRGASGLRRRLRHLPEPLRAARPHRRSSCCTASSGSAPKGGRHERAKPRIGLLGIMQELYDEMIPGITEHQARYAAGVAQRLSGVAEVMFTPPGAQPRGRRGASRASWSAGGVDGIAIVMLTYGPAMRTVRALLEAPVPLLLANIQPERAVTADWDMADLTYNQGIHGAQDQANALVRAGIPFSVITGDWRSRRFERAFADWARAAQAVTALQRTQIALLGYPMNGMGDIRYDPPALLRRLGPTVVNEDLGGLVARVEAVADAEVDALLARPRRAVRGRRRIFPRERHAYAARLELAIRGHAGGEAATRRSRSTSTRSAATAASSSCRCWPPRT